ncbi:MAG: glycosyltransferase family 2 protein [Butyrivibrio sp.]
MIDNGLISIVMAAYNAEKTIRQAIDSVLGQTYGHWELIVVNDCSKDLTQKILEEISSKDSRVKIITNYANVGVSQTRHIGVMKAQGEWIAFLDSDDEWKPEKLEKQMLLQTQTKAELLFTGSAFMDEDGKPINWYLHAPEVLTYHDILKQNLLSNSSSIVKKELYVSHEAMGDGMHEDFASWLSIMKTGVNAYGVDEPLLVYRISKCSKSGNKFKAAKMNWNTYRYVGLNVFQSLYYMIWYTINGIMKYRNLK